VDAIHAYTDGYFHPLDLSGINNQNSSIIKLDSYLIIARTQLLLENIKLEGCKEAGRFSELRGKTEET
jgi:hypothetical protein